MVMSELIALNVRLGTLKFLVAAAVVVVAVVPDLDLLLMPL